MPCPQIRLLGVRTKFILITHLMLYLMPTFEQDRSELNLKCLIKRLVPHTGRNIPQIFARYPEYTVALLSFKFVLLVLGLGPVVKEECLLKYLLTDIHIFKVE